MAYTGRLGVIDSRLGNIELGRIPAAAGGAVTRYAHGQAQARILTTYYAHAQAQADIKQTYYGLAQAQATIVRQGMGQAQAQLDNATPYALDVIGRSPVVYYSLDGTASPVFTDMSGNNRHATITGTVTFGQTPLTNTHLAKAKAVTIASGANYGSVSFSYTPSQFTVTFWLNPTSLTDYNQQIIAAAGWGPAFVFHTTSTGAVYVGTDIATRLTPTELPAGTVTTGTRQFFAFTLTSGGVGKFYKNGLEIASKSGLTASGNWNGFYIGAAGADTIVGKVDEVAVFNSVLTQNDLLHLYLTAANGIVIAQAQARIGRGYGLGQAQAYIANPVGLGYGQAQAFIDKGEGFGQAQAQIKTTYYGHGQAQAWIETTYYGLGQAQGTLSTRVFGSGQAQGKINAFGVTAFAQAQASLGKVIWALGWSQAYIFRDPTPRPIIPVNVMVYKNGLRNTSRYSIGNAAWEMMPDGKRILWRADFDEDDILIVEKENDSA